MSNKQPTNGIFIIIGDTEYAFDTYYREGVEASKQGIPWMSNPYRERSYKYDQWDYGHTNESEGEHDE